MLTLIAESKTMTPCDGVVNTDAFAAHRPALEDDADAIVASLADMTAPELARAVRISLPLAARLHSMIALFGDKSQGAPAIEAFTGVVFKALDIKTIDDGGRRWLDSHTAIVSSLYGWLRPDDIIKPYRFDFTTRLAPDGGTLAAFWRPKVTELAIETLRRGGTTEILDLMPADAARAIDLGRAGDNVRVVKAEFKECGPGGKLSTPRSTKLKTLRGLLLRHITEARIDSIDALAGIVADRFYASDPSASTITFLTDPD